MRRPNRSVELDDIISSQIIGDDPELIAVVLKTHLALEALLIEMLRLKRAADRIYRLSFPAKTEALVDETLIGHSDKAAFDRFNDFRNDLAHIFGHTVSIAGALALARDIEAAGVDFSDSVGHYAEPVAIQNYGDAVGVLSEVGWCILFHAAYLLNESGGRSIW